MGSPDLGNSSHESSARQLHRELQKVVALSKVQPHVDLDPSTEKVAKSQKEVEELLKLVGVAVLVKQKGVVEGLMAAYNQQQQQSPAISNWIEKFDSLKRWEDMLLLAGTSLRHISVNDFAEEVTKIEQDPFSFDTVHSIGYSNKFEAGDLLKLSGGCGFAADVM